MMYFVLIGCVLFAVTGRSQSHQGLLKQSQTELLAGVVNAICYSGFRTGQHPDRGQAGLQWLPNL